MRRIMTASTSFCRRWSYAGHLATDEAHARKYLGQDEFLRLCEAIKHEEHLLAGYRQSECPDLARDRETTLQLLQTRMAALEFGFRGAGKPTWSKGRMP